MAASHTLPHSVATRKFSKLGVLTLYGYGIRIRIQVAILKPNMVSGENATSFVKLASIAG
jgi:hypothetical protein